MGQTKEAFKDEEELAISTLETYDQLVATLTKHEIMGDDTPRCPPKPVPPESYLSL